MDCQLLGSKAWLVCSELQHVWTEWPGFGRTNEWVGGQISGWMDGWTDG